MSELLAKEAHNTDPVEVEVMRDNQVTIDGAEYVIFENSEMAGEAAREYWENLAQDDPDEFACLVGKDTLVQWALGQSAGPGSTAVNSLEEWLDLWLTHPEEHFATYDGTEQHFLVNEAVSDELCLSLNLDDDGWGEIVAYRTN